MNVKREYISWQKYRSLSPLSSFSSFLVTHVLQLLDAQGITLSNRISDFPEALIAGPNHAALS
jgi:hypothetical protein